jgi:hypothetical protein
MLPAVPVALWSAAAGPVHPADAIASHCRRRFPVGATPTRRPLQQEATGAVTEVKTNEMAEGFGGAGHVLVTAQVCAPLPSPRRLRRAPRVAPARLHSDIELLRRPVHAKVRSSNPLSSATAKWPRRPAKSDISQRLGAPLPAALQVRTKPPGEPMHLKGFCVDGATLRTGSANFSASGKRRQDNDLVVLRGRLACEVFEAKFERAWASKP